jgi:hypothetical protein
MHFQARADEPQKVWDFLG